MDEPRSKQDNRNGEERRFDPELLKKGSKCDLDQYEMLKRCSDRKDMTQCHEWRKEHPDEDILLQDADMAGWYLNGVLLSTNATGAKSPFGGMVHLERAQLWEASLRGASLRGANLEEADLQRCDMERITLEKAHLERADLSESRMVGAFLKETYLRQADLAGVNLKEGVLINAHLEKVRLFKARLEESKLFDAHLEGADLGHTCLKRAELARAHLAGTLLYSAQIEGASFLNVLVTSSTLIWQCKVDRKTEFSGVGLASARVDPATRQLLEYNIRRKNWEEWYKVHPKLKWFVKPFWLMSDYGLSTSRIIVIFFAAAFIFANIYYHWGRIAPPGIIDNLFVGRDGAVVSWWVVPLRAFYFSVITMTLGFSDMYANTQSIWGHILITVQALLGYVLLGALVTRFAVLFTAGGPAGKFADEKEKKNETE